MCVCMCVGIVHIEMQSCDGKRLLASLDDAGAFLVDTGLITTMPRFICLRKA